MDAFGHRIRNWRFDAPLHRGGQALPKRGEKVLFIDLGPGLLEMWWRVGRGYRMMGLRSKRPPHFEQIQTWGHRWDDMGIKKRKVADGPVLLPFLSADSKILKDCPLLMEFLTATAFEDGDPRTPGYYMMKNRTIEFELSLYDPNTGQRVSIRAREHDKCFKGAEALLGATDAPWETDRYLTGLLPKKKEKRK